MERAELAHRLGATHAAAMHGASRRVLIDERDPARFKERFAAAVASDAEVFVCDPEWNASTRSELSTLLESKSENLNSEPRSGWLMLPSGGTGGRLKLARHDEATIAAAVTGFTRHFALTRVNAVGVLPLYHVSGLMAWFRCALSGGEHVAWNWKRLEAGERPALGEGDWVISLVPTQLQRLLESPDAVAWLQRFRIIFLGGGPSWPELNDAAARARLRVSLSYGMTETAAMVTALRPAEFLAGERSSGSPMPHAGITLDADGRVVIGGESVFRGYWPERRAGREFVTEDLGRLNEQGHLHLLGRRDAVIITGGKKVQPGDVEAALRASGEFADVAVVGVPDSEWGEIVVACYAPGARAPDFARAMSGLAAHQRPKRFVPITPWPRSPQGKLNRAALVVASVAAGPRR